MVLFGDTDVNRASQKNLRSFFLKTGFLIHSVCNLSFFAIPAEVGASALERLNFGKVGVRLAPLNFPCSVASVERVIFREPSVSLRVYCSFCVTPERGSFNTVFPCNSPENVSLFDGQSALPIEETSPSGDSSKTQA